MTTTRRGVMISIRDTRFRSWRVEDVRAALRGASGAESGVSRWSTPAPRNG